MTVSPAHPGPVGGPAPGDVALADPRRGLDPVEARRRLERYGRNEPPRPPRRPWWHRVLTQLRDPLILVLLGAITLTTLTRDVQDTIVILAVIVLNTTVGVVQEIRADRALAALSELTAPTARVVRGGAQQQVPAAQIVPGDVVVVEAGDIVPADGWLVEGAALQVDESALTGESVPVDKTAGTGPAAAMSAGTTVTRGRGVFVVTATGPDSALGRIAAALAQPGDPRTPLQRRLAGLGRVLAGTAFVLCAVVFSLGLLQGEPVVRMLVTATSLAVAAVPESLPAVATLALALGARRMAARNAIVRRLPAVETLGSVTVLATDKTGTLTEGRMVAELVWTPQESLTASGTGYEPAGELRDARGDRAEISPAMAELLRAAVLCNDAHLQAPAEPGGAWSALGDPTEAALLALAAKAGLDPERVRAGYPRVGEIPFDGQRRRMTTVHALPDGGFLACGKGAPDVILRDPTLVCPDEVRTRALDMAEELAAGGHRVLAVAAARHPHPGHDAEQGLRFLGLVALVDPPRPAALPAIGSLRDAGITPILITGDHPATARAIAERVGLAAPGDPVVTGAELAAGLPDGRLDQVRVFARTSPEQKLQIIDRLRARGHVVAMTGDGVNDGPALRRADIGVAMGHRGTEVAKQAADLILVDDDLGTVTAAVEEGRRVYANIRRFLRFGLSGGLAEILVMLAGPFAGLAIPLLPAQILWINLLTHGLPGVALGAEPAEPDVMRRAPRSPTEGVLGAGLWQQVVRLGILIAAISLGYGVWAQLTGRPARTVVFLSLGLLQLGVALGLRTRAASGRPRSALESPFLLVAASAAIALQVAAVYLPPLQDLLGTQPLSLADLARTVPATLAGYVAIRWELRRARARRRVDRHPAEVPPSRA
ncbi:cation-translocating P-type ATPase [Carbonactinospora thermoautotrophica]|uniref:cation-translocating P-type ATPase n=1 Tax=Carbonactinospora thermoautotrophica TaxID=1469144 RepID=UPI00099ED647|nr:cation-translocating P-type ATPase [Carbonactinospora thermoautotrophica]